MKEKGGKDGEEGEKERRIGSNKEKKMEKRRGGNCYHEAVAILT